MDISTEVAAIQAASQGSELRQPLVGALNKLNSGSLPAVTTSDVGKILKVGANGWEVGEKSGYMPVPTATKQITENGTHDVTDYASAVVNVSGGGSSVLIPKTITQNGTYNPVDDNADGYNEVTVNVKQSFVGKKGTASNANILMVSTCRFSNGSYFVPQNQSGQDIIIDFNQSFEICLRIKITNASSHNNSKFFIGRNAPGGQYYNFSAYLNSNLTALIAAFASSSSSWNASYSLDISNLAISVGGEYEIIFTYDGNANFTMAVSDFETTITDTYQKTNTYNSNKGLLFGRAEAGTGVDYTFDIGEIDLINSYVKIQDNVVW